LHENLISNLPFLRPNHVRFIEDDQSNVVEELGELSAGVRDSS